MRIAESELILRPDGSIYHLKLHPGDLSRDIITVGDPDRIDMLTQHFDDVVFEVKTREFRTVTGHYKGKKLSVISTGIGTDNIDIVFNEVDALFNVDFETRQVKDQLTLVNFYRIGTSGTLKDDIPVDSMLISQIAIGMDGLMEYYQYETPEDLKGLEEQLEEKHHYLAKASPLLLSKFQSDDFLKGITITAKGFYAPQNRMIRLAPRKKNFFETFETIGHDGLEVTNLEMETAGIYAMAHLLGHHAISFNAILANRRTGQFSADPEKITQQLIINVLESLAQ